MPEIEYRNFQFTNNEYNKKLNWQIIGKDSPNKNLFIYYVERGFIV